MVILTEAENNLRQSIKLNSQNADSQYYLAKILTQNDDPSLAKKHFYKALEINPDFALAYYDLAFHAEKSGDINEAKIHFKKPLMWIKILRMLTSI